MNKKMKITFKLWQQFPKPSPQRHEPRIGKTLTSDPPFRNTSCKHYNLCLDYAIFCKPKWSSFSCQGCRWINDKTNQEVYLPCGEDETAHYVLNNYKIVRNHFDNQPSKWKINEH